MTPVELVPIEATRIDPLTGNAYTFRANPPIDLTVLSLDQDLNYAEFLITFCWRLLAGEWDQDAFPELKQQITDVLPILITVAEKLHLELQGDSEFINPYEAQSISIWIKEGPTPQWEGVSPAPSKELLDLINNEVIHSQPVLLGTKYYLNQTFIELANEELKKRDADNASNEEEEIGSTEIIESEEMDNAKEMTNEVIVQQNSNGLIKDNYVRYGLHFISQNFDPEQPYNGITPQDLAKGWQKNYGVPVNREMIKFGLNLGVLGWRLTNGIVRKLTQTSYQGDIQPVTKTDLLSKYPTAEEEGDLPKVLNNVVNIPRLLIGKREILRLAGMDYDNEGNVKQVIEELDKLTTEQYCFYYSRCVFDKNGKPKIDKNGKYEMEDVYAISTLFEKKVIYLPGTDILKYYEIQPSPIFLDQNRTHFMLVPANWQKELETQMGRGKVSKYIYSFLMYLNYRFAKESQKRRNERKKGNERTPRQSPNYQIKCNWVVIAKAIGMPESVYKGKKHRAMPQMIDFYTMAKKLGYLSSFTRNGEIDTLILDPSKYYQTKEDLLDSEALS